ncbi:hypothetical protein VE03_08031 [Pseudogymnoascus sp. 23342-1-I1]|nr:hypothetical protein VE03_08031 [Pseudogymnoascus sp. 23342-1-I1]
MILEPIDDNPQVQSLTVALKNICRDYPAGGTVLRELLQNADDAGATEVRFILDERTHPTDELINPHLRQYQGPALLAYNSAEFTDHDFRNLLNIGNSLKLQDGLTTGKFGRGFNSVYNWTDSPSIVSRERLLVLDPHRSWSNGGPYYDFVKNSESVAIQNQMGAFQSVLENQKCPFKGTIIRIPLRTKAQATKSEISSHETTVSEIREVIRMFADEFRDGELLFMRNVEKLGFESTAGMCIKIEMANCKDIRSQKSKINSALKDALKTPGFTFNHSFKAEIEYSSAEESGCAEFAVHHNIRGISILSNNGLRDWAKDQKLIPWVAVAARIPRLEKFQGKLFSVLPLPIATRQPVYIHGLFSISPDRARLYQLGDTSAQDRTPALWNDFLFHGPVPEAWAKLLSYLAVAYPHQFGLEWWPQYPDDSRDSLIDMMQNVIKIIENESLPLFPSEVGYVAASSAFLATGDESVALRDALKVAKAPVVYIPQRLRNRVRHLFNERILSPPILTRFLANDPDRVNAWKDATKQAILEYLMSEPRFFGYETLKLFPFEDGQYRSVKDHDIFVHRDEFERNLFCREGHRNIDLSRVSAVTKRTLIDGCETWTIHPSIKRRSIGDLRNYCMNGVFNKVPVGQDMVVLDKDAAAFVSKAWAWIEKRRFSNLAAISDLWLLPLTNSHFRKIRPRNSSSEIIIAHENEIADLLKQFDAKSSSKAPPLLHTRVGGLSSYAQELLVKAAGLDSHLFMKDSRNVAHLTRWLNQNADIVNASSDEEKGLVVKHIASTLPKMLSFLDSNAIADSLRPLEVFRKLSWKAVGDKMVAGTVWTCLDASELSIGLLEGINPIPEIDKVQFIDAPWSSYSQSLLEILKIAECKDIIDIIERHVIKAWKSEQATKWEYSVKEQASALLLRQYSRLRPESQRELQTLAMVPVANINGHVASKFSIAEELVDPSVPELRNLFFDEEEVIPVAEFFSQFQVALKGCGLKTAVDEALINRRIRCYSNSTHSVLEVQKRASCLLKSTCRWTSPPSIWEDSELRKLKWLPVTDVDGILRLDASNQCRGLKDRLLVNLQLPILDIPISAEWEIRLGWTNKLPHSILLGQLSEGLGRNDREIVDAICFNIVREGVLNALAAQLMKTPFVLTTNGVFVTPSKAFCCLHSLDASCDRLHPYLENVDNKFWQDHSDLLTHLKVGKGPYPKDLLSVQTILESKVPLGEADIAVAIEILNLASRFDRASLTGLKVLSNNGKFYPIEDISYHNLGPLIQVENVNLTHPDISLKTIRKIGIELLSDRQIKGLLEISDIADEDEFDQKEQVTTGIANTLDAYPVNSTFREYLANADDTKGASAISWLLDERYHPDQKLLTPELKRFQGPSFLVYNDGVFSEDDFKGFKNVGEGSKRQNTASIGQFGRGSQTMYHWTDVPMILSGKYLLILDPQQEVLPKNQIKGKRKPGVKLELSKLKDVCPDQLAPFEGLWRYTKDLDYYPGTIFRFPLRLGTTKSRLKNSKEELDGHEIRRLMDAYFDEARISLLFLRRICSIDFTIYGKHNLGWSLSRQTPLDEDTKSFSQGVVCSFTKIVDQDTKVAGTDNWWVAIEDLQPEAEKLPYSPRRLIKNIECGIAALVSSKPTSSHGTGIVLPEVLPPRIFSILPLPVLSDLPIYIHATFSLSGDRRSLILDEHGEESHGSSWNRYLFGTALPKLYISFLDNIGARVPWDVISFWPQITPPKRSCSETVCSSFWTELPKSSRRLFPKAQPNFNLGRRQAPELFDIKEAMFDFLPEDQSNILVPLLLSLELPLVRRFPPSIADNLKALAEVKWITGSVLRELFKSESNRLLLQKAVSENPEVLEVLLKLAIPAEDDQSELDGCHFLPLSNGTLGTLKLLDPHIVLTEYYVASTEEIRLFEFASKLLVSTKTGKFFEKALNSRKFNIQQLQLHHARKLFMERVAPKAVSAETNMWLNKFWNYWNVGLDSLPPGSSVPTDGLAVYLATCNGRQMYVEPPTLETFSAVIKPTEADHQYLCGKIPGLYILDNTFMPASQEKEGSLSIETSFYRFIKATRELARKEEMSLGVFLETHLDLADMKILRSLLVAHAPTKIEPLKAKHQEFVDVKDDLKSIPFWPSCDTSCTKLICINDALMTDKPSLLVPWIKEYSRFIEPEFAILYEKCLLSLDIKKMPEEVLINHILPLPELLSGPDWHYYKLLVRAISQIYKSETQQYSLRHSLKQSKIAADKKKALCRTSNLFDHEDQIFTSAFRIEEESRFLHNDIKGFRSFWVKLGLRHREHGILNSTDYLQCLQAMERRIAVRNTALDAYLESDCLAVLAPLITPSSSVQRFGPDEWVSISWEAIFLTQTDFNIDPEYRRRLMATKAAQKGVLRLSEIVSHDYAAVCWSQTSFAAHEPTKEVLSKIPSNGKPSPTMVWRHVESLKELSQNLEQRYIRSFLADLHSSYAYIQDHLRDGGASHNIGNSAIWLNLNSAEEKLESLEEIHCSWTGIQDLVLSSSCDAGRVKAVRPGLMRFENLLRSLGCQTITYPTVTRPAVHHGSSVLASLQKLRDEGKLLDVKFFTEGKYIEAHRVVLAAVSEKCAAQFSGRWPVESVIKCGEEEDPVDYLSYHTLSTMINFAYEDKVDWSDMEISDTDDARSKATKLDMLLDLLKGADYWLIPALKSQVENRILDTNKEFVNIENATTIRERAAEASAKAIEQFCIEFIQDNHTMVERAKS